MKMNFRMSAIVLALSCISFSTALNASTLCRNALFLAFIFSLFGLFRQRYEIRKDSSLYLLIFTTLFACSFILHGKLLSSTANSVVDENYYYAAIRLLMGGVTIFYLYQEKERLSPRELAFSRMLILTGFFYLSMQGVYLHSQQPGSRLEIKTVATTVAYVYTIQLLAAAYVVLMWKNKFSFIISLFIIFLGFYVILLTETRSVMLTYPFIIFLFLVHKRLINVKVFLGMVTVIFMVAMINNGLFYNAFSRIAVTLTEVKDYHNNDGNTSLGSRFSLWKAGIHAFELHPLGQSADQRVQEVKRYIDEYENRNPEALRAMGSHLHNDFIDTMSLRGVWGVFLLVLFLSSLAYFLIKKSEDLAGAMLLLLPNIIYGLTDTLFIDLRCVTVLILGVPVYLLMQNKS